MVRHDRNGFPFRFERRRVGSYSFYTIVAIFVLFVGLRSSFNDTYAYIKGYKLVKPGWEGVSKLSWALGDNPGFHLANSLLKTYVIENAQGMLIIYALIPFVLFFKFYRRWSEKLWLTIFLFSASGMLLFSMAAMKQVLAMAIGLYGVNCFLRNHKLGFVVFVLLGSTFHPYLLLFLGAFFLDDRVWSRKVMIVLGSTILGGLFIQQFVQLAYTATNVLGEDYAKTGLLSGRGVNVFRFLVYSVTPTLTWIYRKKINASCDKALILFANFTLIGWCFMIIARFIGANMFARMAMYFDPFMHLTLTALLIHYIPRKNQSLVLLGCVFGYLFYLLFELYNRGFVYCWILG